MRPLDTLQVLSFVSEALRSHKDSRSFLECNRHHKKIGFDQKKSEFGIMIRSVHVDVLY